MKTNLNKKYLDRSSWKNEDKIFLDLKEKSKQTIFVGYDKTQTESKLLNIILNEKLVKHVEKNQSDIILIFDKTPFTFEAGGQVGDSGNIYTHEKNLIGKIIDTKKLMVIFSCIM